MKFEQATRRGDARPGYPPGDAQSWRILIDPKQNILNLEGDSRHLTGKSWSELVGRPLGQLHEISYLARLARQGFSFRGVPVNMAGMELLADYLPDSEDGRGMLLTLTALPVVPDGFAEIRDFVSSIDATSDIDQDGIILVDREGVILLVNQNFAEVLGIRAWEMVGRHVHETYPNSNLSRLPKVMEKGQAEVGEPHLLNGRPIVASRWPLVKNGKTVGAFGKVMVRGQREQANTGLRPSARSGKAGTAGNCPEARYSIEDIVGHSPALETLREKLVRVAGRPSAVLLTGESGTGKELFAHALHRASPRRTGPFIRVNCAAIPEHLLESELFGYVDGAFTGAKRGGQVGKFEKADGGTIFLDEISDMSVAMQAKLLRVLQEKEVTPLGTTATKPVDFRLVAATNADLTRLVKEGKFRQDLFYRLNVVNFIIPPLRERSDDIYLLAKHFIEYFNEEFGLSVQGLETQAWAALRSYTFPGNVRELQSAIESAFNMVVGPFIRFEDLPVHIAGAGTETALAKTPGSQLEDLAGRLGRQTLVEIMEAIERDLIEKTLALAGGNKLNAANLLGISRPGLYKKLQKYQLQ